MNLIFNFIVLTISLTLFSIPIFFFVMGLRLRRDDANLRKLTQELLSQNWMTVGQWKSAIQKQGLRFDRFTLSAFIDDCRQRGQIHLFDAANRVEITSGFVEDHYWMRPKNS